MDRVRAGTPLAPSYHDPAKNRVHPFATSRREVLQRSRPSLVEDDHFGRLPGREDHHAGRLGVDQWRRRLKAEDGCGVQSCSRHLPLRCFIRPGAGLQFFGAFAAPPPFVDVFCAGFWAPAAPCSRDTAGPPAPTAAEQGAFHARGRGLQVRSSSLEHVLDVQRVSRAGMCSALTPRVTIWPA